MKEITLKLAGHAVLGEWNGVFENVEYVSIQGDTEGSMDFNHIFPSMQSLVLRHAKFANTTNIEQHFPNLQHLRFVSVKHPKHSHLPNLLRLHSKLRSLTIDSAADIEFFRFINEQIPNLQILSISSLHPQLLRSESHEIVEFKNLKEFCITAHLSGLYPNHVPFAFDQLETMECRFNDLSNGWTDFIVRNKKLTRIVNPLPNLK